MPIVPIATITIPLTDLDQRARMRPAGYREDVLRRALRITDTHYTLTREVYEELRAKYQAAAGSLTVQPCSSCGKDVNPAEVKASPQAMERFLAGE